MSHENRKLQAFTLIEIMVVVLVIGILLGIAVPFWMGARTRSQTKACLGNPKQIEGAKEQLAMENNLPQGTPVVESDLWPDYFRNSPFPSCPAGGVYALNSIGTPAICDQHGAPP